MKGKTPDTKAHSRPDSVPEIPRLERLEAGSHCQRLGVRTIGRAMSGEFRLPLSTADGAKGCGGKSELNLELVRLGVLCQ